MYRLFNVAGNREIRRKRTIKLPWARIVAPVAWGSFIWAVVGSVARIAAKNRAEKAAPVSILRTTLGVVSFVVNKGSRKDCVNSTEIWQFWDSSNPNCYYFPIIILFCNVIFIRATREIQMQSFFFLTKEAWKIYRWKRCQELVGEARTRGVRWTDQSGRSTFVLRYGKIKDLRSRFVHRIRIFRFLLNLVFLFFFFFFVLLKLIQQLPKLSLNRKD